MVVEEKRGTEESKLSPLARELFALLRHRSEVERRVVYDALVARLSAAPTSERPAFESGRAARAALGEPMPDIVALRLVSRNRRASALRGLRGGDAVGEGARGGPDGTRSAGGEVRASGYDSAG